MNRYTKVTPIDCPSCGVAARTGIATISEADDEGQVTACPICRLEVHGTVEGAITGVPRHVPADEVINAARRLRPELFLDDAEELVVAPWDRNR